MSRFRRVPDRDVTGRGLRTKRSWSAVAALLLTVLVALGCGRVRPQEVAGDPDLNVGPFALGDEGAVVSVDGYATEVGLEVLRAGGNAVDAAIAVGFALAVTHPQAGNLGGGGFMVVYLADEDRYTTVDFREEAPGAATVDMYLGDDDTPQPGASSEGWLAVGVPGTVAGLAYAHGEWGKLEWPRLVEPAVRLAREGYLVSPYLAESFERVADDLRRYPAAAEAFLGADGSPYLAGERFRQPDLAWSLERIAYEGPADFYRGQIAERLATAMEANGGLVTLEDLAAYEPVEREPVRGAYRDWEIVSMGPPSSGGVTLIEMLNILETFEDLGSHGHLSPQALHLMIEAMRQAYLDRARHLGDPDHVDVPIELLTSDGYARRVAADIPRDRARSSAELGRDVLTPAPEPVETTHYSVMDARGNAVSLTYTIENGFGARVVAAGTGFLLNNEMSDFNEWPGVTDERGSIGTPANLIAPAKRPLSSMTPTILARDGRPALLVGSPGGKTIINTVLRVVTNVVDFGLSLPDAVAAPRLHHQWMPDRSFVESGVPGETVEALRALGHDVLPARWMQGDAHCIWVYPDGVRLAVADPRRAGAAAAY